MKRRNRRIRICALILVVIIFITILSGTLSMISVKAMEGDEDKKIAYLTFDDGPSENTPKILDILKEEGIHATFFIINPINEEDIKYTKRAFEEGNAIGNHTYDHEFDYIYASKEKFWKSVDKDQELIKSITGKESTLFRFPGGSKNSVAAKMRGKGFVKERIKELEARGITYFNWNVDSGDGITNRASTASIYRTVMKQCKGKNRPIILMHDAKPKKTTIQALPMIIKSLKEQGYSFDTLDNYYKE